MTELKDSQYFSALTGHLGDMVHYEEHELRESHPECARFFSFVGILLRHLAKEERLRMNIEELLKVSNTLQPAVDNYPDKEILELLMPLNSVMLVDALSRVKDTYSVMHALSMVYTSYNLNKVS